MQRTIVVCDVESDGTPCEQEATTYVINGPDGCVELDLCARHADLVYRPFRLWGRAGSSQNGKRRQTRKTLERPFFADR